jgi:hypothetical protein
MIGSAQVSESELVSKSGLSKVQIATMTSESGGTIISLDKLMHACGLDLVQVIEAALHEKALTRARNAQAQQDFGDRVETLEGVTESIIERMSQVESSIEKLFSFQNKGGWK